jgi:predicted transcriptional regulator
MDIKNAKEIYNKYKNIKSHHIYEIILQLYLIYSGFRDVDLVRLDNLPKSSLEKIIKFLGENNILYHILKNKSFLVLYNPNKFNIDKLNESAGKKFGQQLGDFYNCASNDFSKNHYRIVISVNQVEIFAQMCKKSMIQKNISKYYKMYLEIMEIFWKLDKNIFGKLETYGFPH